MFAIDNVIISDDVVEEAFHCDLNKCKGACCVEGDEGAMVEEEELPILESILATVLPFLPEDGKKALVEKGPCYRNEEGQLRTTLLKNQACAFSITENGILFCGIEKAWRAGQIDWPKPISCHLYPIRIKKSAEFELVNYERWEICAPACDLGKKMKLPVYRFLKDALIRKYGAEFYEALDAAAMHYSGTSNDQ